MDRPDLNKIIEKIERISQQMEQMRLDEYLHYARNWPRRLFSEFLNGIARGVGFSIGFTILGALLLYMLRNIALANLPLIGKFLADLVRIVENNL